MCWCTTVSLTLNPTIMFLIFLFFCINIQQMQAKSTPMLWPKPRRFGQLIWKPSWRCCFLFEHLFSIHYVYLIFVFSCWKRLWFFHRWVRCRSWGSRSPTNWITPASLTQNTSLQRWIIWTSGLGMLFLPSLFLGTWISFTFSLIDDHFQVSAVRYWSTLPGSIAAVSQRGQHPALRHHRLSGGGRNPQPTKQSEFILPCTVSDYFIRFVYHFLTYFLFWNKKWPKFQCFTTWRDMTC